MNLIARLKFIFVKEIDRNEFDNHAQHHFRYIKETK